MNGNGRAILHMVSALATAIAGGTVSFVGISDIWSKDIAAVAALIGIAITTYLASSTTGASK